MKTTVTAIMQARLGSTRLPGKVLLTVKGKSFLEHGFERLELARNIDQCVVATTMESKDDEIGNFCEVKGWNCTRGSEIDVLDRYYQTALQYPADIIVRVTSDCPLLDPALIEEVVEAVKSDFPKTSYASNTLGHRHFPRGLDVEAFTFESLEEAWRSAQSPSHREHVTPFINTQPERFTLRSISFPSDCSEYRWTLDTQEDHDLLYKILDARPEPSGWQDVLKLVKNHPEWSKINSDIKQKKI